MLLLHLGYLVEEEIGDFIKTLFPGDFFETPVHLAPLVVLAGGGILEIVGGVFPYAQKARQSAWACLELVLRCLHENTGNLLIPCFLRFRSSIHPVLVAGPRLACKKQSRDFFSALPILFMFMYTPPVILITIRFNNNSSHVCKGLIKPPDRGSTHDQPRRLYTGTHWINLF